MMAEDAPRKCRPRVESGAGANKATGIDYSEGGGASTIGTPAAEALEQRRGGDAGCGAVEHS